MAVLPVYKPLGYTPLQCITEVKEAFSEYKNSPVTYAGRLDPMADGLIILLTDETRYQKQEFLAFQKTYDATFLIEIETDSLDILGMPTTTKNPTNMPNIDLCTIRAILHGPHNLPFPNYSSYKVKGKPLHWWTQQERLNEIRIPEKRMEVLTVNTISIQEINRSSLLEEIVNKIPLVQGNFRQEEIMGGWKNLLRQENLYTTLSMKLTVTSGTYIRSLSQVIASHLNAPSCLLRLRRTIVGPYNLHNALQLHID